MILDCLPGVGVGEQLHRPARQGRGRLLGSCLGIVVFTVHLAAAQDDASLSCDVDAAARLRCSKQDGAVVATGRFVVQRDGGSDDVASEAPVAAGAQQVVFAESLQVQPIGVERRAHALDLTIDVPQGADARRVCLVITAPAGTTWRADSGILEHDGWMLAALGTGGIDVAPGKPASELRACAAGGRFAGRQRITLFFGAAGDVTPALLAYRAATAVDRPVQVVGKDAPEVRQGYLFVDLTQANTAEVLDLASRAGFPYVLVYAWTWASSYGSYPINPLTYPNGEEGLRRVVGLARQRGIRLGLHTLTSLVGKSDPLVTSGRPDDRLLVDDRTTLAADVTAGATTLPAATDLASFPSEGAFYGNQKAGTDLRVGDEIVRCPVVKTGEGARFESCTRGVSGTKAAPHAAGTPVLHLAERYGCYLADLHTTLADDIAARLAHVIDAAGIDLVYFDAGEVNSANGPASYWVAEQQIAVLGRVQRPVLVEGSGLVARLWPFLTRAVADDFAALAPAAYLDVHKIGRSVAAYGKSRMPAQLGWIGLLPETPGQPPTRPEDMGTHVARSLAYDIPFSIETKRDALRANPYLAQLLATMAAGNATLARGPLSAATRDQLRSGEWVFVEQPARGLAKIARIQRRVQGGEQATLLGTLPAGTTGLLLRIGDVSRSSDDQAVSLLSARGPVSLVEPEVRDDNRGIAGARVELGRTAPADGPSVFIEPWAWRGRKGGLDLTQSRRMLVEYQVGGDASAPACSVLNLQLEDGRKNFRDYFVDLQPGKRQRVTIEHGASAERMLRELTPVRANYAFKASVYGFDFDDVRALNVRWMKACSPGRTVRIERVAMLREQPASLEDIALDVDEQRLPLVGRLVSGDTLELGADGSLQVCRQATCTARGRLEASPALRSGAAIRLRARGDAGALVTLMPVVGFVPLPR